VCLTETAAASLGDERSLGWRDALACLEDAGAAHIAVNPATKSELAKAVMRIAVAEGAPVTQAAAGALVESARGDIRAAVAALQMRLAGAASGSGAGDGGRKRGRGAEKGAGAADKGAAASWGARDDTLSLFHALGKLLYNKRVPPPADAAAPNAAPKPGDFPLAPLFRRAPPEVKDPEAVLAQAALTPAAALAFLHGAWCFAVCSVVVRRAYNPCLRRECFGLHRRRRDRGRGGCAG
jgi:cell cycle checkpoint protein